MAREIARFFYDNATKRTKIYSSGVTPPTPPTPPGPPTPPAWVPTDLASLALWLRGDRGIVPRYYVVNGGAEYGDTSGWQPVGPPTLFEASTVRKFSGTYSFHCVADPGEGFKSGLLTLLNRRYRLRFKYYIVSGAGGLLWHLVGGDAATVDTGIETDIGSWETVQYLWDDNGGAGAEIIFVANGPGALNFHIDEISLDEVDADDLPIQRLGQWEDQSGHGRTFAASGPDTAPQVLSGPFDSIYFDGTTYISNGVDDIIEGPCTIVAVFRTRANPTVSEQAAMIYSLTSKFFSESSELSTVNIAGYQPLSFICDNAAGSNSVGLADATDVRRHRMVVTYNDGILTDPASYGVNMDGSDKTIVASGVFGATAVASCLGCRGQVGGPAFLWKGELFELIAFQGVLTGTDLANLLAYLAEYDEAPADPLTIPGLLFWTDTTRSAITKTSVTVPGDLCVNGGMEDGDPPTGWSAIGSPTTFERSNVQKYSGTYSLHVVDSPGSNGGGERTIPFVSGRNYVVKFRYYMVSGILKVDSDGSAIPATVHYLTGGWRKGLIHGIANGSDTKIRFYNFYGGGGAAAEFYIDEVEVYEVARVTQFNDLSGNGRHFTPTLAGDARMPVFLPSEFGSRAAIGFDGQAANGDLLLNDSAPDLRDECTFAAILAMNSNQAQKVTVTNSSAAAGGIGLKHGFGGLGDSYTRANMYMWDGGSGIIAESEPLNEHVFYALIGTYKKNGSVKIYRNGVLDDETPCGAIPETRDYFGLASWITGTECACCSIVEACAFDHELTLAEMNKLIEHFGIG